MQDKRLKKRRTMVQRVFDRRLIRIVLLALIILAVRFTVKAASPTADAAPEIIAVAAIYIIVEFTLTLRQKKNFIGFMENFDFCLSDTTGVSLVKYPAPVVIIDLGGEIKWYNGNFKKLMGGKEIFGIRVQELIPEIQVNKLTESRGQFGSVITVGNSTYEVEARVTGREDKNRKHKFLLLYDNCPL